MTHLIKTVLYLFISSGILFSQSHKLIPPRKNLDYDFGKHFLPNLSPGPDSVIRYDFTVSMPDGTQIDALKYIPFGVSIPSGGFPTVIMVHDFGSNKETVSGFCHDQATYGYYTAAYSVRGQGNSGGLSNLISTTEAQDLINFVDYIKQDSVNGSNPNNILIMGGSQGGLIPYMAACNGLNVKTIISALSPPDFASSWIENGCIKITFLYTISYPDSIARYSSLVTAMRNWVYNNSKYSWDSLAYWLPQNRDFMADVPNNHVQIIVEGGWQDKFFNASGIIKGTTFLTGTPLYRMYIGSIVGHGSDYSSTEAQWHLQFFNDWFLYWLFGVPNGENTSPTFEYASTSLPYVNGALSFIHDSSLVWPDPTVSYWRLYFNTDNKLSAYAPGALNVFASFNNTVSTGLTLAEAVNDGFTGPDFNSKFTIDQIIFETSDLRHDTKLLGAPLLGLEYYSTCDTFCQYNFQIYEVTPDGTAYFINRINFTDRNYTAGTTRDTVINGQAHSHIFSTGNKIRIVATNLDRTGADSVYLGTSPFVLPVLNNGTNRINLNSNSYIDLPITTTFSNSDDIIKKPSDDPVFTLKQNYPNPFNPSTKIEYSIPATGKVVLKVFDVLGREVRTLINEFQEKGFHNVMFDASNLASGVYFYRVQSGLMSETKKLVVLK